MRNIVIVGAGAHALEIYEYILTINQIEKKYNILGLIDDSYQSFLNNFENQLDNCPNYLGKISDYCFTDDVDYVLGISSVVIRKSLIDKFPNDIKFTNLIHPRSYVSPFANLGRGNVIAPNVNIGPMVEISDFNLINGGVAIGHNSILGSNNILSPNCCLSGGTKVGDNNFFGINASTFPNVSIGNHNQISAGMILDKNIENESVIFFRFKEKVLLVPKV